MVARKEFRIQFAVRRRDTGKSVDTYLLGMSAREEMSLDEVKAYAIEWIEDVLKNTLRVDVTICGPDSAVEVPDALGLPGERWEQSYGVISGEARERS